MNQPNHGGEKRSRFSIRSLLAFTLIVAIGFLCVQSALDAQKWKQRHLQLSERLMAAENQLSFRSGRNGRKLPDPGNRSRGFLSGAQLDGSDFRGVVIRLGASAFQRTSLNDANLQNAVITAGGASFQFAQFDGANLQGAKLTGGGASFQLASFVAADLSQATLTGSGSSFQLASFRNANLTGATITGPNISFQAVDLDSAKFEHADLSAIAAADLAACYFSTPPTYNANTRFPTGFDPVAVGWKLTE